MTPGVVLFGDSITASYSFNTSPGAAGTGWYNGAQAQSAHPFALPPVNAGIGSQQTDDMLARITASVYAYNPSIVHVLGGANDVANSRAAALVLADLEAICDGILADGASAVILGTVYPTASMQTAPKLAILDAVNSGIRSYAAGTAGVYLAEYCLALAADGHTMDDAADLIDTVHPSKSGNAKIATVLAPILATVAAAI